LIKLKASYIVTVSSSEQTRIRTKTKAAVREHFLEMARYNAWANARLYRMAASLPDESYKRAVGVYFKSLHGTLNHILVADSIWMRRLTGAGNHPDRLDAIMFDRLPALDAARMALDARIIEFVESLTDSHLEEMWEYRTLNGTPQRQRRRDVLAHVFNHQTHHRGQAHAIVSILGVAEPTPLDLLLMQREQS